MSQPYYRPTLPNTPENNAAMDRAKKIANILIENGINQADAGLAVKDILYFELFGDEKDLISIASGLVSDAAKMRGDSAIKTSLRFKSLFDSTEDYKKLLEVSGGRTFHLMGILEKACEGVRGGEVATIVARSGAYKTCILENLLINQAEIMVAKDEPGMLLFFSFEMPEEGIAERALQISTWKTVDEVVAAAKDNEKWKELMAKRKNPVALNKVRCYYGEPVTVEEMADMVLDMDFIEPVHGIAIDYVGYIKASKGSNRYEKVSEIARDIKIGLARKLNIPVIQLSQANRAEGKDGTEEITLASARDSGAIEESTDFMYGLWKEEKEDESPELWGRILKERRHFQTYGAMNPYFVADFIPSQMRLVNFVEVKKADVPSQKKKYQQRTREV